MSNTPNLFLIGAMKSGTSLLAHLLATHPEIFMATPKEPCGLALRQDLEQDWPDRAALGYADNLDQYLSLYRTSSPHHMYRGDASTLYAMAPRVGGVPERMARLSPDARIIYILREPIARMISQYRMERMKGLVRTDFWDTVRTDSRLLYGSEYHTQLKLYLEHFKLDQIYVLTFEALIRDQKATMQKLFRWLNVSPHLVNQNSTPVNSADVHFFENQWWARILMQPHSKRMLALIPSPVIAAVKNILFTLGGVHVSDYERQQVATRLSEVIAYQRAQLEQLLGRTFVEWDEFPECDALSLKASSKAQLV